MTHLCRLEEYTSGLRVEGSSREDKGTSFIPNKPVANNNGRFELVKIVSIVSISSNHVTVM